MSGRALFLVISGIFALVGPALAAAPECSDVVVGGGLVLCRGEQPFEIVLDGQAVARSEPERYDGIIGELALLGVRRDRSSPLLLYIREIETNSQTAHRVEIIARNDEMRQIEGMDCDRLDARTEAQKSHAARSWTIKQRAFASFHPALEGSLSFVLPSVGPVSSPFGPARRYVGVSGQTGQSCEKTSVHKGLDLASPSGSELRAPLAGTVILAEPDLYYEGGCIFIDHGRGLISVFLHLSTVSVRAGQKLSRGDLLGTTGATGRTSGPHLHWGVKWRNTLSADRSGDLYIDPTLLPGMEQINSAD